MINEELTTKTIRPSDKVKVARVIADMLGVEDVESMSPDTAVNQAFRKVKAKRMTPEFIGVIRKMISLATEVGIKIEPSLIPKQVSEEVVEEANYNIAGDILKFKDYAKLDKLNKGIVPVGAGYAQPGATDSAPLSDEDETNQHTEVGHSLGTSVDDHLRRRKVAYKTEETNIEEQSISYDTGKEHKAAIKDKEKAQLILRHSKEKEALAGRHHMQKANLASEDVYSADYKINPETGRKSRAHRIDFAASGAKGKPSREDEKDDDKDVVTPYVNEEIDFSDEELESMASEVDTEDKVLDAYDPEELMIVDQDTGEEVDEEDVNEEALNEVLSRVERMKAKIRFMRTKSIRSRRLQIALKRRSDVKTLTKRARRLAISMIKQRLVKKPVSQMSVAEKERVENMLKTRKALVDRLSMRLLPRVRKIENDRLSHSKATQPAASES